LSAGKTDIWMPVYIGDYLADTMRVSTEQHGGYLLLLFHLWRRGILPDDVVLAQITGLGVSAWSSARQVLGEFFEIRDGLWHHGRVERGRSRIAAKQQSNSNNATLPTFGGWSKPRLLSATRDAAVDACGTRSTSASRTATAMPDDAKPDSKPELLRGLPSCGRSREMPIADPRHAPSRAILAEYWKYWSYKNHASPEMPWQGLDAEAPGDFLAASPNLNDAPLRSPSGHAAGLSSFTGPHRWNSERCCLDGFALDSGEKPNFHHPPSRRAQ
jgi:uncharacterized protein YdaU (DUF1376 family)